MKYIIRISFILTTVFSFLSFSCRKYPIDDNGLLVTTRSRCYVSFFDLLGSDGLTVVKGNPDIDTTAQTINVVVKFGSDLTNLYPQFTLATDCILKPNITGPVDFSDTSRPHTWTVVSGNRKIKKEYTIYLSVVE